MVWVLIGIAFAWLAGLTVWVWDISNIQADSEEEQEREAEYKAVLKQIEKAGRN